MIPALKKDGASIQSFPRKQASSHGDDAEPDEAAKKAPYTQLDLEALVLSDGLALERTVLANERTFLAYVRTALALLVAGASLIHFFDLAWARITGWSMLPATLLLLLAGVWRYLRVRATLRRNR